MTSEARARNGVPIWALALMAVLVIIAILLFLQAQQASTRADEAARSQASAEVAQSTAVANAQQAGEAQATQKQVAADSAVTATVAQGQAEDQANTAATIQAQSNATNAAAEQIVIEATSQAATSQAEQQQVMATATAWIVDVVAMVTEQAQEQATEQAATAAVMATQVGQMQATGTAQATLIEAQSDQIAFLATEETNARMTAVAQETSLATAEAALQIERGRALITLGTTYRDSNYPYALLLAVEAYRGGYWQGLYETLDVHPEIAGYLADSTNTHGAVAFSPDGRLLAVGDNFGEITLWNTELQQPSGVTLYDAPDEVRALAFSPDGKWLVSGGSFGALTVWDVESGQPRRFKVSDSSDQIASIAISPDGKLLAAAGSISHITVWDMETGEQVGTLQDESALPPTGLAFSPDGTVLAATNNGIVFLWNVEEGAVARRFSGDFSDFNRVAFSPDGKSLVTTRINSGDALLWNLRNEQLLKWLIADDTPIRNVVFSPDGTRLITASTFDVRMWDISAEISEYPLFQLSLTNESGADVSIAPDASTVAVTDGNRVVLWRPESALFPNPDLPPDSHAEAACRIAGRNMTLDEWQQAIGEAPYRKTCDDLPIHSSVIQALVDEAVAQAQAGANGAAEELYAQAVRLLMDSRDAGLANNVCWFGSLYGFAETVLPACERALEIMPGATYIADSRGLARALTGDTEGAVADFQTYLDWTRVYGYYDLLGAKREAWIASLQAGENPFDEATLQALLEE